MAGLTFLHGYYHVSPYTHGTMRYYSFDGSYLYATVTADWNWTVYLPDGTKVVMTPDGIQRVQDTNGNKIKIYSDANGTHYQDEQTGREIRYAYNPSGNNNQGTGSVFYRTVGGGEKSVDINFGFSDVVGQVIRVNDWIPSQINPRPCVRNSPINIEMSVIREIVLPQTEQGQPQRKFTFTYNSDTTESATNSVRWSCNSSYFSYTRQASKGWGGLNQVTTPAGAVIDYSYQLDSGFGAHLPFDNDQIAEISITQKKLTHDGTFDIWTYSVIDDTGTMTAPDGSISEEKKYTHSPGFSWAFGKAGLVYRSTRPFTRIDRHWTDRIFSGASTNSPGGPVSFNPIVDVEYTTLLDAAGNQLKMSAKVFQYDYNGNLTQTTEYDWFDPAQVSRDAQGVPTGVPGSAVVLRTVNNSYYNPATSSTSANVYAKRNISTAAPLILNALQQTSLGPAITQFSYDGQSYGVVPTVGNLTSESVWDNFGSKWVTSSQTFGANGNVTAKTDPRGKVTQFYYDDPTRAFPTRVVADPQNGTGTQTKSTTFDYYTGLVLSQTDPNGNTTSIDYTNQLLNAVDPHGRPGIVFGPSISGQRQRVTTTYLDSARQVIAATDLNSENDQAIKSKTTTNVLGQVVQTQRFEDSTTYIAVDTQYDSMGRPFKVSYPYKNGQTPVWTTTAYDTAGRIISVTTPDNGVVATNYVSNTVTVGDQMGRQRKSVTDAGGRVVQVYEDPAGLNYLTSYSYDVLNNLTTVSQGAQTRTIVYDSIKRLRSTTNPESGTITYQYDDNGNLKIKTDARGVTSTYEYDALNRNTSVDYSDATPDVYRQYDLAVNGKGRLNQTWQAGTVTAATYIDEYDGVGRPRIQRQRFETNSVWSDSYTVISNYNVGGLISSQTYPSGHTVNYSYDTLGRMSSFSGNLGDGASRNYAADIKYGLFGGMIQEQFGTTTPLFNKQHYNIRGQLYDVRVSTASLQTDEWNWNRGALVLYYGYGWGESGPANNANLTGAQHWVPSDDQTSSYTYFQQNYSYDSLNRLQSVAEYLGTPSSGPVQQFAQAYAYDRYSNRIIDAAKTWGTGINNRQFTVDAARNRLGVPGGQSGTMSYDAGGNLLTDSYSASAVSRAYDAENRMTSETQPGSYVAGSYGYNADGQRVRRNVGGVETWEIYGMNGELLADYAANGATNNPQKEYGYRNGQLLITAAATQINWLVTDHLGTTRIIVDQTGSLANVKRHDYLPFGEELLAGTAGRTTALGYAGDNIRHKFTRKERDLETGLDYFGARYYSSVHGRFTSADPVMITFERIIDPQRLNLYAYVRNNPLGYVDPNGADILSIELVTKNANQLAANDPKWKSQEAGRVEQLGPVVHGGNFVFTVNIVVTVTPDDSPDNYEPVQKTFVIFPNIKNVDPHRPGEAGKEKGDNPEKKNVMTSGKTLVWFDNPGLATSGIPPAGVNNGYLAVFTSTVSPKKGGKGKETDKVLYWGVKLIIQKGKIVTAVAEPITPEQYYKLTGQKPPKPPAPAPPPPPPPQPQPNPTPKTS